MGFGLLNLLMLVGLAGLAIPPLIHLLNRRRYVMVDWGAMQFLQISETTRRRLLLEELLLMLLRMVLIGVLVLALAAPYVDSPALAQLAGGNRDVVLVIDGSASMGYTGTGQTPHEAAREWATAFLDGLAAGDSVALLQAKQQVVPVLATTHDLEAVRRAVAELPPPAGGCDWPQALQAAHQLLGGSRRPQREIVLIGDGQRFGWADDNSLLRWELLSHQLRDQPGPRPRVWVVNVAPDRPAEPPNWALAPVRASRAVASAGQQVTFRTALELRGRQEYRPPHRLRLEVDRRPVTDLPAPTAARLEKGQVPFSFRHRFPSPGSHLVSVIVDPDPPPEQRPAGYTVKDHLPGDNRQDFALEILPALPVLLVDGDTRPAPKRRGTDFLRDALAPARDRTPVVLARVVSVQDFDPALLARDLADQPGTRPRVLVLSDVPRLTREQTEAVAQFLENGGGVLVTLGERAEAGHYNEDLFRGGQGWLPARLEETAGDLAQPQRAASPLPSSFFHPALDLFREVAAGGLGEARFPRWWRVSTPGRSAQAVPVALLTTNDPLFVERSYNAGRVLLCAVPLDNSWRTNLPDLPAFAPLAHELVYYLAGARGLDFNLQPGQPIRFRPAREELAEGISILLPDAEPRSLSYDDRGGTGHRARLLRQPQGPLIVYEGTRETGVYGLKAADGSLVNYVVQADPRESELAPATDADRARVAKLVPLEYEADQRRLAAALATVNQRQELWWWVLLGVIGLLCGEVWMTRRLVSGRG